VCRHHLQILVGKKGGQRGRDGRAEGERESGGREGRDKRGERVEKERGDGDAAREREME
jgi:ribonuclease E